VRWHKLDARESEILAGVLKLCWCHPAVAMSWRVNVGMMEKDGRVIRFGVPGQGDIEGVLKGGRYFTIECKTAKGKLSPEQRAFLENVRLAGGMAAVVRSVDEAKLALDMAQ